MIKYLKSIVRNLLPDKICLKYLFYRKCGYRLNLKSPKTFNEKLQWLKLYDRNPEYTKMVDKYEVKKYVADKIGEKYIIPTLGVYNTFDEIDFDKLPNQFVLKCTHDSGGVVICKNKKIFEVKRAREKLQTSLKHNYYYYRREWAYKNVPPKIIAEKYINNNEDNGDLRDYKILCFNGEPKIIQVDYDRFSSHKRNLYDLNRNYLPFELKYPTDKNRRIDKPECLNEMLDLAKKLSKDIPHSRIDFYIVNKKIYFGEITLYHGAGFEKFSPKDWDYKLGEWIKFPQI